MLIFQIAGFIMIAVLLMNMTAKARPRIKEPAPGKALKTLPMGVLSRFEMQRSSFLALLTGIVFGVVTGWLPLLIAGIVGVLAIVTILLPMRYTFTTKGIALGDGMFYPWSDFSGFAVKGSKLKFARPSFFGQLTLFVKPAEMNNVLEYVERYVRTS